MNTDDGWPKVWAKMSDEERELSVSLRKNFFWEQKTPLPGPLFLCPPPRRTMKARDGAEFW